MIDKVKRGKSSSLWFLCLSWVPYCALELGMMRNDIGTERAYNPGWESSVMVLCNRKRTMWVQLVNVVRSEACRASHLVISLAILK